MTRSIQTSDEIAETLLEAAKTAQTAFWDALGELERHTGFEIDSAVDLAGYTLEDLEN